MLGMFNELSNGKKHILNNPTVLSDVKCSILEGEKDEK
eukprot:04175.XXX_199690_203914_1 [CDS] Oithona nana genome sequencing.